MLHRIQFVCLVLENSQVSQFYFVLLKKISITYAVVQYKDSKLRMFMYNESFSSLNLLYSSIPFRFHAPDEGPQIWKKFFHISPGRTVLFTLSPMLVITSPDIQKYSLDWRQCFFNSERSLRFYKQYTQRNCEMECMSNFTLAECGCVEFSMPSIILNSFGSKNIFFSAILKFSFFFKNFQFRSKRRQNLWTIKN